MKIQTLQYLLLALLYLTTCACKDDNTIEITKPKPNTEFYDTPFDKMPALDDVVMYEANQRVFAQSGSLNAIIERLDEIRALGVNVLWLMPINQQGKEKAFGSPYCVRDFKKIESEYGTMDDLRNLVKEAHNREMAVIIDWVANHTAWDNPWLKNNPDWFTKHADGQVGPPAGTNWNDVVDLEYNNREMRKAMIEAMKFWVRETNIDGFRCDAADWVPADFWKDAIYELRNMQEGRTLLMLAEGTDPKNLQAGFDMDYAWNFGDELERVFAGTKTIAALYQAHNREYNLIPSGKQKLRHNTNHDRASEHSPVQKFFTNDGALASFVIATTLGGTPLIYSSQEVAYNRPINFFNYVPVDWNQNGEFLSAFKQLMSIYNSTPAFKSGELVTYPNADVVCFTRTINQQEVLVMVNVRAKNLSLTIPEALVNTKWTSLLANEEVSLSENMDLSPYQYLILEKK